MVLNAAVQILREADELKQKILKFKSGTSMLQERSLWTTQQELQKVYQKVLILDLDYALDKKVEQDLWNVGFKQQIEALQAISKDRKNPLRSEGQAMLSWILQAAAGFYLCLLHQICTTFKLDLPFSFAIGESTDLVQSSNICKASLNKLEILDPINSVMRRASLLGWVEGWGAGETGAAARVPPPPAARYICQHCLVHLGDLARYRQQLRVAHTFYRHALVVSAHSGQPYNQLALVAWRRGRRLCALYWHVRSLLVRAPFPPAPANLTRTLAAAAAASRDTSDLPVLPGLKPSSASAEPAAKPAQRLDSHAYVTELIRALHMIHTLDELETAKEIVQSLNSSLSTLIATDSFDSMTLIRMSCVIIWLVHHCTEDLKLDKSSLSESEAMASNLAESLAADNVLALLLPAYTLPKMPESALPALKVWLQWLCGGGRMAARAALWPALAHALNTLQAAHAQSSQLEQYDSVPLPEDEELHGFTPLEQWFEKLRFPNHASWDTYAGRVPDIADNDSSNDVLSEVSTISLSSEPQLEQRVRVRRLWQLGKRLAELYPQHLTCTEEDGSMSFEAVGGGGSQEQLSAAVAELCAPPAPQPLPPAPPLIISEADFREKVREKRVGILKPQGSLERAREERALASTQDDQQEEVSEESSRTEDKKEIRKARVNIAMAAIMRKQEETNKQVKFISPPPTPDSTADVNETKDQEKPKVIQPKVMKSLANLPIGRKTGGILSLKDKSAGYPHLVNTDPEPAKKMEKDEKKDIKPTSAGPSQNSQTFQQKRIEPHPTSPIWGNNVQAPPNFEGSRMNFPKSYSMQSPALNYQVVGSNVNNQGIRLPVVNPKEIDVRSAALQKQNSRPEMFQDGHKFNHNYQISGDKKNFLNDLPPRFANQYRYWQNAQENRLNDNKFMEDTANNVFPQQPPQTSNWLNQPSMPEYQPQPPWWKPENQPNFTNYPPPINMQPNNYYSQMNVANPYQTMPSYQIQNQSIGQNKDTNHTITPPNYLQTNLPQFQMQNLQNLVTTPNFNSPMSLGNYSTPVGYDASMYPQFNNKLGYPPMKDKLVYQEKDPLDMGGLNLGSNMMELQRMMKFNDPSEPKMHDASGAGSSTYSLFSGAPDTVQRHPQVQSLWSGPGPSPLERLLEQQKQMKSPQ